MIQNTLVKFDMYRIESVVFVRTTKELDRNFLENYCRNKFTSAVFYFLNEI